ncbi:MAG: ABC transporter ATP-binding protein, partial [Ruminococcus sp.]|nr:ABC transporter ATP-binding protein [Ruminococcus sp.]
MEILTAKGLSFCYPECDAPAVSDVSFALEAGSFNLLAGSTGSGKSTLLRLLKRELSPLGDISGEIEFRGKKQSELSDRESALGIGFVMQQPDAQIVCDKVWHELVFTLENAGADAAFIAFRAAETASYFGIDSWYEKNVSELSGGQKQLLNLASVMMGEPGLLILDEPTAQLDPIAASEFIHTVKKLSDELGLTVLIAEHRLDELVPVSDRLLIMDGGRLIHNGSPRDVIRALDDKSPVAHAMPAAARLYKALGSVGEPPLTVAQGRGYIRQFGNAAKAVMRDKYTPPAEKALELKDLYFRYGRNEPDILTGLTLDVYKGEILCILGANGSGKTTAARC